jgi:diguanylate cyclase (GGDEF)-like protein
VREDRSSFRRGLAVFLLIDIVIALIAYSPVATHPAVRLSMEIGALALSIGGVGFILWRRIDTPLMWLYTIALAAFAQSSVSFLLAQAWDHQWWLGHLIFAGGFFVLSYGVLQAFHTTRAFSTVYSLEEMMRQLEGANNQLALQAATDPLTGVANRRHFVERFGEELARRQRAGTPLSLLAVDIDHFKRVNDSYGHAVGDATLIVFTARVREQLRAADLVGRIGGEEFSVLLPDVGRDQAGKAAERIRAAMANQPVVVGAVSLVVTVSVGVAEFGPDGETIESLMRVADERLYRAKAEGRNRVVAAAV